MQKHPWLVNIGILVGTIGAIFILLEIGVRIAAPQYQKTFQYDDTVGITRIPNSTFTYFIDGEKISHRVNSDGYKTPEIAIEKPYDTVRILLLGDSMTEAIQVADRDSFRARLEEKLGVESQRKIEVINLGYSGYGTAQELLALEKFGLKYQPDLVILDFFADNDVANNSQELESGNSKPFFELQSGGLVQTVHPAKNSSGRILSFITDNFVLPRFVYNKYQTFKARRQARHIPEEGTGDSRDQVYFENYDQAWNEAWQITFALISQVQQDAQNSGSNFLLVSLPSPRQIVPEVRDEYVRLHDESGVGVDVARPERILSEYSADYGIDFLSLFNKFSSSQNPEELYIKSDGHLSSRGHEVVAGEIDNFLLTAGFVETQDE